MKYHIKSITLAWLVAGFFGSLATILWLLILLGGEISGMAGLVVYIFLMGYGIGHLVIFLPVFLLFFEKKSSWVWKYRFMIPVGFLIGGMSAFLKGEPLSEPNVQKAGFALAIYGVMLAASYVSAANLANKWVVTNRLPAH